MTSSIGLETSGKGVAGGEPARKRPWVEAVVKGAFAGSAEFTEYATEARPLSSGQVDYLFAEPGDETDAVKVFPRLRWGGQYVFCSPRRGEVEEVASHFHENGFQLETSL